MKFQRKTIFILSQQGWDDGIFISKHHYAIELASRGNTVYFIGGPSDKGKLKLGRIKIEPTQFPNLYVVEHELFYPLVIKFKLPWLHKFLIRKHIKNIIKKTGKSLDIVWSFDLSNTIPLTSFDEKVFKIFMPVDEPQDPVAFKAAESAKIIFSVTNEILEKYKVNGIPKFCINHGVSRLFLNNTPSLCKNDKICIGLSGNFLRPELDKPVLIQIIEKHADIQFHFFGKIDTPEPIDSETTEFVNRLKALKNTVFHGSLVPAHLAEKLNRMDAFLICYDILKDQSKGTNYHKLLEYLATGKVTITNNVTSYKDYPELVVMNQSRTDNRQLPEVFEQVVTNLEYYNSPGLQEKRIEFASNFRYDMQVSKIENLMNQFKLN